MQEIFHNIAAETKCLIPPEKCAVIRIKDP